MNNEMNHAYPDPPSGSLPEPHPTVQMAMGLEEPAQGKKRLEKLLAEGFAREEAMKLLHMKEGVFHNSEMRQRMDDDPRLQFARWLQEHGELNEGI